MSKKVQECQEPIFIHSLFRSGSTYIFNVFRRSQTDYYCYQEPLNEDLQYAAAEPERLLEFNKITQKYLRHPELDKPYFEEFYLIADKVGAAFHKEFSYEQYFTSNQADISDLKAYFTVLMEGTQGHPLFQCCRSAGRMAPLKSECGGIHIFLWRNPWDQWWSYKKDAFFELKNLLILQSKELPSFLSTLKKELETPFLRNEEKQRECNFINNRYWLGTEGRYKLFYGLWCHAMLEAEMHCDLSISIDELSLSSKYRLETETRMIELGINGLDFSDCLMPSASYGESDSDFFLKIESYIHGLLLSHGYSHAQVGQLMQLSEGRLALVVDTNVPENSNIRDAMRAREYLLQVESELTHHWSLVTEAQEHVQILDKRVSLLEGINSNLEVDFNQANSAKVNLEEETRSLKEEVSSVKQEVSSAKQETCSLKEEVSSVKKEACSLKEESNILQKQNQNITMTAHQLEEELKAVYASKSWRIMLGLRKIMHFLLHIAQMLKSLIFTFTTTVMRYVIKQPQLKRLALDILYKFPRIKNILNKIALRAGLSTKESAYDSRILKKKISEQETTLTYTLTPTGLQIYNELKQSVKMEAN